MKVTDKLLKLFGLKKEDYNVSKVRQSSFLFPLMYWLSLDNYQQELFRRPISRQQRFIDYDLMDLENGDIGFALDLYAEECLRPIDKENNYFVIKSENKEIVKVLNKFIAKHNLMEKLFSFTRALAKYGEIFIFLSEDNNNEINKLIPIHPSMVEPVYSAEMPSQSNEVTEIAKFIGWKCPVLAQLIGASTDIFYPFKLVQIRIPDYGSLDLSGKSMLANAVKNWRMLDMLEVMAQIYRMNRSVEKILYNIDVGEADITEAMNIVQEYQKHLGQMVMARRDSGEWFKTRRQDDFLQEIFFPKRSSSNSSVELFPAPGGISDVVDLEYFRDKLRISLGIPVDYFNEKSGGSWDKGKYLSYQDMRFSRRIVRLQQALAIGLKKIFKIYLVNKGIQGKFKIEFESMSIFESKMKAEILKDTIDVISSLIDLGEKLNWDKTLWSKWVLDNFLNIPQDLLEKLMKSSEENVEEEGAEGSGVPEGEEEFRGIGSEEGAGETGEEEIPPEEVSSEEETGKEGEMLKVELPKKKEIKKTEETSSEYVKKLRNDFEILYKEIYQELSDRLNKGKK